MTINPALRKRIEAQKWFHAIDFGEFSVPSFVARPGVPPNGHLYPAFQFFSEMSLAEHRCLDMGTFDGLTAFVLDRMGAGRVDATCQHDLKRFRLAKEALQADRVVYHPQTQIEELIDRFGEGSFDLVVLTVALHHLMLPQEGLFICRRLLKRNGLFVPEAGVFADPEPVVYLNPELEHPIYGCPTVWIPSATGLEGMLRLAGFDQLARIDLGVPKEHVTDKTSIRMTTLNRAVRPADIRGRSEKLADIQEKAKWTGRIDYRALSADEWPESSISYTGPEGQRSLDVQKHITEAPLQPRWSPPESLATASSQPASVGSEPGRNVSAE